MTTRRFAATIALVMLIGGCSRPDPATRLRDRLDSAQTPDFLDFTYETGGTTVTRCFRPNTAFAGTVDARRKTVILRTSDDRPVAVITPEATVVRSALFAAPPPATWLRIPKDLTAEESETLSEALGAEFASYLVDQPPPPTPAEVTSAALDVASNVTETTSDTTARYTITIDGRALDRVAARQEASTTTTADSESIEFQVLAEFRGDEIASVTVDPRDRSIRPPVEDQEAAVGWTTTYRQLSKPPQMPKTDDIAELDRQAVASLQAALIATCQVRP